MKLINLIKDLILMLLNLIYYLLVLPYNIWAEAQNRKFRKNLKVGDMCRVDHFFMSGRQGIVVNIGREVELEPYGLIGFKGTIDIENLYKYKLL